MFAPDEVAALTDVLLNPVFDDETRAFSYDIAAVLKQVLEADERLVHVYAGAVYDRKGYVNSGTVSSKLDKSPYQNNDRHYVLRVEVVVPEYMQEASGTKELFSRIAEKEEESELARLEARRQDSLRKAAELREQAAALENEARKLEAQ